MNRLLTYSVVARLIKLLDLIYLAIRLDSLWSSSRMDILDCGLQITDHGVWGYYVVDCVVNYVT